MWTLVCFKLLPWKQKNIIISLNFNRNLFIFTYSARLCLWTQCFHFITLNKHGRRKSLTLWGNKSHISFLFWGALCYLSIQWKSKTEVKNIRTFKTTSSGCIVSVRQRQGSRFLLCRALIEFMVRHQAGEIIKTHNGHKTTGSGRGRKGFARRDSLHAVLCSDTLPVWDSSTRGLFITMSK